MDDRCIKDRPRLQHGPLITQDLLHAIENLTADAVLLEQVAVGEASPKEWFRIVLSSGILSSMRARS